MYIKQKNANIFVSLENYTGDLNNHPALTYPSREESAFTIVDELPGEYVTLFFKLPAGG